MDTSPPGGWALRTILLATDGSEFGAGAARVAVALAVATKARIMVLSVVVGAGEYLVLPPDPESEAELATHVTGEGVAAEVLGVFLGNKDLVVPPARAVEAEQAARATAEGVAAECRAAGAAAEAVLRRGHEPALTIVTAAHELGADLIVLGRRGKRNLARRMLGDATGKVICRAGCPVLVVPKGAAMWRNRVLLATDGSAAANGAVKAAAVVARVCGLGVTALSVEVPKDPPERRAETARIVDRAVASLVASGVAAEGRIGTGAPPDEIVAAVADCGVDLVVMGSEGRTALGRLLVGSNSLEVIGRVSCPVLVTAAGTLHAPQRRRDPNLVAEAADRTFLVVVDDTPEMPAALVYACRRARSTGGKVSLLRVIGPEHGRMFGHAVDLMRSNAEQLLENLAGKVEQVLGSRPQGFVREGDACAEVLALLESEPGITALVLASGAGADGPGTLVTQLATRHARSLPVPLTIVPSHLTAAQMDGLA